MGNGKWIQTCEKWKCIAHFIFSFIRKFKRMKWRRAGGEQRENKKVIQWEIECLIVGKSIFYTYCMLNTLNIHFHCSVLNICCIDKGHEPWQWNRKRHYQQSKIILNNRNAIISNSNRMFFGIFPILFIRSSDSTFIFILK